MPQHVSRESGGGPPHSMTLARGTRCLANAERLGVRQSSGALGDNKLKVHKHNSSIPRQHHVFPFLRADGRRIVFQISGRGGGFDVDAIHFQPFSIPHVSSSA